MGDEDDFDFKRMLEQISDPAYAAAAAHAAAVAHSAATVAHHHHQQHHNQGGNFFLSGGGGSASIAAAAAANRMFMAPFGDVQAPPSSAAAAASSSQGVFIGGGGGATAAAAAAAAAALQHHNLEQFKRELSLGNQANSGSNVITSRLRAASDMHQHGVITNEQKSVMKGLILSRDPHFREEFEKAERTQDWSSLKTMLSTKQQGELSIGSASDTLGMSEFSIGKDRSGSASSVGALFDLGLSRKRNASTSTPVMRSHKFASGPQAIDSTMQLQDLKNMPSMNTSTTHSFASYPARTITPLSASAISQRSGQPDTTANDEGEEGEDDKAAKFKKNERERRRRATLSNGFDALAQILKIPPDAKLDKAAILQHAVVRIAQLQNQVDKLEAEKKYASFESVAGKQY